MLLRLILKKTDTQPETDYSLTSAGQELYERRRISIRLSVTIVVEIGFINGKIT